MHVIHGPKYLDLYLVHCHAQDKRRLTTNFREIRSQLNHASNVNKWSRKCKDGRPDNYLRSLKDLIEQSNQRHQ